MNEIPFYAAATLTADPESHTRRYDTPYATLSLEMAPRNRISENTSEDGMPFYLRAVVYGYQALNVLESLRKDDRVIVVGRLQARVVWASTEESIEVIVDEIGPSLQCAIAQPWPVINQSALSRKWAAQPASRHD
jgi:single-strand DNA-binding protein